MLSPLLFAIFINDIFKVTLYGIIIAFADDITIVFSNKNFKNIESSVEKDMKRIFGWILINELIVNLTKSHYMLIGCDSKKKFNFDIHIEETDNLMILGVIFDKRLSF